MSHVPHELVEEFPELADQIAQLRQSDSHFAKMADKYHEINRAVHRAETNVEPSSDDHITAMRKERLSLKDGIYAYLKGRADAI